MKFKTIYSGEKAIVINRNGEKKIYDGPKRVFLLMEKLEKLSLVTANVNEYLVIKYIDGQVEHKQGPISEWFNRFKHLSIKKEDGVKLNGSQMIVVYKELPKENKVNMRVVEGPCLFICEPNEWLHQFVWHKQDSENIGHLIPEGHKFNILTKKTDFFHYHVKEARTLDDTLITVKLMLIYELNDILTMLNKTQDPISDFINAICADVIGYVANLTLAEFLKDSGEKLNKIDTYQQLKQRADRNGYKIHAIIYNGYLSSQSLQKIQDTAIEVRTQLRLNCEIDEQLNKLVDLNLKCENEQLSLESELNKQNFEFEQRINDLKAKFEANKNQITHRIELSQKDLEKNKIKELDVERNRIEEEYLIKLNELGVDVNNYKIETNKSIHKLDRVYKFV